jgi:hypothetical protein
MDGSNSKKGTASVFFSYNLLEAPAASMQPTSFSSRKKRLYNEIVSIFPSVSGHSLFKWKSVCLLLLLRARAADVFTGLPRAFFVVAHSFHL